MLGIRILAALFLIPYVMGFLWFIDSHGFFGTVAGLLVITALVTIIFIRKRTLETPSGQKLSLYIGGGGIAALLFVMYGDITLINGPDVGAFIQRLLLLAVLIAFLGISRSYRPNPDAQKQRAG